jgi:prevent-host-death family protein
MEIVNASTARANLFGLVEQVNQDHVPRIITSKKGDAVLLSKEDWDSLQETLYLQSISGLVEAVKQAELEDDWVSEAEFLQVLDDDVED